MAKLGGGMSWSVRPTRLARMTAMSLLPILLAVGSCSRMTTTSSCTLIGTYDSRGVYKEADGVISFAADVDVNTDGAMKSYHPDDPGSFDAGPLNTKFALNTVCNGISIMKPDGSVLYGASKCRELLVDYARLRPLNWRDTAGIYVRWFGIASTGPRAPCIDAASGYFVSQTKVPLDGTLPTCDPARWPDALALSSIVLPYDAAMKGAGVQLGDVALVREPGGKVSGAVFLDTNNTRLGEGSVKVLKNLRGVTADPVGYRATVAMALPKGEYFVFPGTAAQVGKLTNASEPTIQKVAAALAAKHGIAARKACTP